MKSDLHLSTGIVIFSLIYTTITLFYKIFLSRLNTSPNITDNVFVQTWGHSYIADFLILSIPILITKISQKFNWRQLTIIIFIMFGIAITNSRSAMVALIIGILLCQIKFYYKLIFGLLISIGLIYTFFFANHLKTPTGSRPEYWTQAIQGFTQSPILGNGPGNFGYLNRLYRQSSDNSTNYAHNSFLEFLSGNGIIFTLILFVLIGYGLWYQFHHHYLYFVLGITTLVDSLLDPAWSSPGIITLALIIIFWKITIHQNKKWLQFLVIILGLFFISKTTSDILFFQKKYNLSLLADPINPNSLSIILPAYTTQIYQNDPGIIQKLIDAHPLPQNENYYYQLIQMDPHGSISAYIDLMNYYFRTNNWSKLQSLLDSSARMVELYSSSPQSRLALAKLNYFMGIHLWQNNNRNVSLAYFQQSIKYSYGYSHYYIELANAYAELEQHQLAEDTLLKDCATIPSSTFHCRQYQQDHIDKLLPVGEFYDAILNTKTDNF